VELAHQLLAVRALALPGPALGVLPNAQVVEGLAVSAG
jgi:hypothetical protein